MYERFWSKVEVRTWGECWPWRAGLNSEYGWFNLWPERRSVKAHRVAFFLARGYYPLIGRHMCDHRWCCNPWHILDGTRADNVADAVARGQHARGERHGNAKLTPAAVVDIRARWLAGERQRLIASRYGISQSAVSRIVQQERWAHL